MSRKLPKISDAFLRKKFEEQLSILIDRAIADGIPEDQIEKVICDLIQKLKNTTNETT